MRDHLRALLITLHIIAVVLMAAPVPQGGMSRSAWKSAMVQDEITAWAARLSMDPGALEADLWQIAEGLNKTWKGAVAPFRPYYRHCGTTQSWRLFVIPQRYPAQLHIELRYPGQDFQPLYIARSDEAVWMRQTLDTERMRSLLFRLSWSHYKRRYLTFGKWIATQAAAEFPEADAVRLRWFRQQTPTPAQVAAGTAPEGAFENDLKLLLGNFR